MSIVCSRPPPKAFQKRGGSLPDPPSDESPPASLGVPHATLGKLQGAESRESLVSHSSSHGTPSITERVTHLIQKYTFLFVCLFCLILDAASIIKFQGSIDILMVAL